MNTQIHPTAVIDASVQLGAEVQVGPYVVIEAGCVIGDRCEMRPHAVICGGSVLGPDNQVGYGAVIGAEPQDVGFKGHISRVEIGSGNKIREHVTIHRSAKEGGVTSIGNGNFLMVGSHIGHDSVVGNQVILANHVLLGGYVRVEDRVFMGGASIVHQHVRIGTMAIAQGGSAMSMDVPPYFMAINVNQVAGINRVGLRRAGLSQETRRAIQAAFELIYRSKLNVGQALGELRAKYDFPEITRLVDFIAGSKRGICRDWKAGDAGEE
jgi:UDP-N-acetylglucosamine acyltransferase